MIGTFCLLNCIHRGLKYLENQKNDNFVLNSIISILNDEIVKVLLKNSILTEGQFITLLIERISDLYRDHRVTYDEKAKLRECVLTNISNNRKSRVGKTRGSYRRVLEQAANNIIKAIYTIFLLGYTGILDSPSLISYVDLSESIRSYLEAQSKEENKETISYLKSQLMNLIMTYSQPFFKYKSTSIKKKSKK